jgi:peroxiredoxin
MLTQAIEITDARREQRAPNFTLPAANGLDVTLYRFAGRKRAVLYFPVSPGDAASQLYARNLAALRVEWDDADAVFLPILAADAETARAWADENARGYSVLRDADGRVRDTYFSYFQVTASHALLVLLDVYCAPLIISHAAHASELLPPAELPKWLNVLVCACSE